MIEPLPARSIVDTHTHTRFSDGVGTFMENAAAAVAAGCRVMVSTDHLTLPRIMDPGEEVQVPEARLAEHRAAFEAAAAEHPELEYIYGFECDWYDGCEENIRRWSAGALVRLGSVHWLGPIEGGAWIGVSTTGAFGRSWARTRFGGAMQRPGAARASVRSSTRWRTRTSPCAL